MKTDTKILALLFIIYFFFIPLQLKSQTTTQNAPLAESTPLAPSSQELSQTIDFSYDDLKDAIMANYTGIRRSEYELDLAVLDEKKAKYLAYPTLKLNLYGFPIVPDIYKEPGGKVGADWSYWNVALGGNAQLVVPIYTFGRIPNAKKAALYNRLAKEQGINISKEDALWQLKNIYWGYLGINSYKKYVIDVVAPKIKDFAEKNKEKFLRGEISRIALENSRVDYLNAKRHILDLNYYKESLDGTLGLVTRMGYLDSLHFNFKVRYIYPLELDLKPYEYYLAIARQDNPTLRQAFYSMQAAKYWTNYQKADIWPKIGFAVGGSFNYFPFPYPFGGDSFFPSNGGSASIGFFINWDLSLWNTLNERKKSVTRYLEQVEDLKYSTLSIENNLKQAYNAIVYKKNQLNYQSEMLTISQRSLILTSNAQTTKTATNHEISDALNDLYSRLQDYYLKIKDYNMAIANFEKLLGRSIVDYEAQERKEIEKESHLKSEGDDNL